MKSILKIFTIISMIVLMTTAVFAIDKFADFPNIGERSGDILLGESALGKDYVKISSTFSDADSYILLYKIYNQDKSFKKIKQQENSLSSTFNIKIEHLNSYEFCIIAIQNENILKMTPIEVLEVGERLGTQLEPILTQSKSFNQKAKSIQNKSIHRKIYPNGLELTLDIDKQSFPYINLLVKITKDGKNYDGSDLAVLNKDAFGISEDNRMQSLTNLIPPQANSTRKIADIVFVHDDSGSLGDEASQVKANIQTFLSQLDQSGIDYRVGLLPYGGAGGYSNPSGSIKHGGNLHDNGTDLISDINDMRFDGGTERAFDAMNLASNSILWRQSTQKIIILITDEDNDNGSINESTLTSNLKNNGVTVYGLTRGHSEFNRIATATGGKIYNITNSFGDILNEIGAEIISKYIIQYKSDNVVLDGLERDVNLTVKVDNREESIIGKYTPTPPVEIITEQITNKLSEKGQREYVSIPIHAKITKAGANSNLITAKLYYRDSGGTYNSVLMSNSGNSIFVANIPNDTVIRPKVEYYISAIDSSDNNKIYTYPSNDPGNNPIVISVLPNVAPEINIIYASKAKVGSPFTIKAIVEDVTNEVTKVTLYYREKGSNIYTSIESVYSQPKVVFEGTIPAFHMSKNGMEYYIDAVDDLGVHKTYGSATNPIQIHVTSPIVENNNSKEIGNLIVYADKFTVNGNNPDEWLARGQVTVGNKFGNKILSFDKGLMLNYTTNSVKSTKGWQTSMVALKMKRNSVALALDLPLYKGDISIDCSPVEPVISLTDGVSTFRPGGIPILYPAQAKIIIKDEEIVFTDVYSTLSSLSTNVNISDLILSQVGNSSQKLTLGFEDLTKFYKIKNSKFKLGKLSGTWDVVNEAFSIEAYLKLEGIFGRVGGFGATLGFAYSPKWQLNTVGGKIGFSKVQQVLWTFPTTPPSPFGVRLTDGSFLVDGIATGRSLKFSATGGMKLTDALFILEGFEQAVGTPIVSGQTTLLVDMSGKVVASGNMKLFEVIPLANTVLTLGNPTSLETNIKIGHQNIGNVLLGRVYFHLAQKKGKIFEMNGQSNMTLQIPEVAPWIGGTKLQEISVDGLLRLDTKEIKDAQFIAKYNLFFTEIGIRLDLSDWNNPNLYLKGFGGEVQVFKTTHKFSKTSNNLVTVNKNVPYVFIKVISNNENSSADFNITLPNGDKFTPSTALADKDAPNIDKIFFMSNSNAKEAYYAIKNPENGSYKIDINNNSKLGGYSISVIYPNDKPKIVVEDGSDMTWDGSSAINIAWTDSDKDNDAKISLYYSTENNGHRGTPIAIDISEDDTADNYDWIPSADIQSGDYYVFAKIDDGEYAPTFVYRKGKITINNSKAPTVPQNIKVTPIDGGLKVTWDSIAGLELSYRIYVSEDGVDKVYDFASGTDNEYIVHGLKNDTSYGVQVQAINSEGYVSLLSDIVSAQTPFNKNNPGGAPDLVIDTLKSSVTSSNQKIDGDISIKVFIKNIGDIDASFAKVKCYYGKMDKESLLDTKAVGTIEKDGNITLEFNFNTQTLDQNDSRMFYILIEDVVSDELITTNNVAVLKSKLSKNEDINSDFEVNILDYMKVQVMIDSGNTDLSADINNDGSIDTDDLTLIKSLWGKKY